MSLSLIQFALFYGSPIESITKTVMSLQNILGDVFDAEATILPASPDIPPEIPIAILQSKDESKSLNISRVRMDIFFKADNPLEEYSLDEACHLFDTISQVLPMKDLSRFGVTLTYFSVTPNPVARVWQEYLQGNAEAECDELLIRYNQPFFINENRYNFIRMIQNAVAENESGKHGGIAYSYDINTDPARTSIRQEDIDTIIDKIKQINNSEHSKW